MLTSLFGDNTGHDHKGITTWTDPEKPGSVYENPAYDRVPADEELVDSEAASLVGAVGQSISWGGYTLTVDANLYDQVTKCGVLTLILENPAGIAGYRVQSNGEVTFPEGELISVNQYWKNYLIQEKTTDTKLTIACYYRIMNPETTDLEVTISEYAVGNSQALQQQEAQLLEQIKQEVSEEEAIECKKKELGEYWDWYVSTYTREEIIESGYWDLVWASEEYHAMCEQSVCPDKITIPEQALGEMSSITLADGGITVSPIAMHVDITGMEDYPSLYIGGAKIRFKDGTEYVVQDENTANYVFAVSSGDEDATYMFNRMVDVKEIASVILDGGLEFPVN